MNICVQKNQIRELIMRPPKTAMKKIYTFSTECKIIDFSF